MKVGIVSDLHRHLPLFVERAFAGCDQIICAGDTEDEQLLWQLQTIAAVTNVRGNNDWAFEAPFSVTTEFAGVRFYVVHRPQDIRELPEGTQAVVHGHTHKVRDEEIDGVRYLNPGSPTYPRGNGIPSCMVLEAENSAIRSVKVITK